MKKLTLEQKASLCSGADFWHLKGVQEQDIPQIMVTDGPNGLRKQDGNTDHVGLNQSVPATCFPSMSALGSSWDVDLAYRVGVALGEECRQEKVAVILGPGLNIKRSALCGRNFEYLSEDPHLAGKMAASLVRGVQSQGVGTSPKHFAANNQETRRMSIDTIVDERALREIYLAGFEEVVTTAKPMTLMTAYNQVNGTFCAEHDWLVNRILRKEWGFQGVTVTDWGGINDRVAGLLAGQDLEMPSSGGINDRKIVAAVKAGRLDERVLDVAVQRILELIFRTSEVLQADFRYDQTAHQALAREAAAASTVLLKNAGALPLKAEQKIAVVGRFAKQPRYQGSGSSKVTPSSMDTAWDALEAALPPASLVGYCDGTNLAEASALAAKADVVLVFAGLPEQMESEGFDRTTLAMPESHHQMISAVAAVNPQTVVVLSNGAPILMPWLDEVNAVLETYLGGQGGGGGVVSVLTGQVNPSGRLAETFPAGLEAEPCRPNFPGGSASVSYAESVWVGYRYYDTARQPVLFPFGHGLSYTTFEWSDLRIVGSPSAKEVQVCLRIKNTGSRAGSEVVQLYVRDVESAVFRPAKELKAFTKVPLAPGEEKLVEFTLSRRAFAFWDTGAGDWAVEAGAFELLAGASSADIRLKTVVELTSADQLSSWAHSLAKTVPEYYQPTQQAFVDLSAAGPFARLLGRTPPLRDRLPKAPHTRLSTLQDIQDKALGRLLLKVIQGQMKSMFGPETDPETWAMMQAMVLEMPLRSLGLMSQGKIGDGVINSVVFLLNVGIRSPSN